MDESSMYSGVDNEPNNGIFGNEIVPEQTKEILDNQKRILKELTPQLEGLIAMIDSEIDSVMSIDRFTMATIQPESDIRAELQAAALYKQYLVTLKNRFILDLNETKKK